MRILKQLLTLPFVAILLAAGSSPDNSLLSNPGFEFPAVKGDAASTDQPEKWQVFGHENDPVKIELSTAVANTGSQSVHIASNSVKDSYQGLSQQIHVDAGKGYQFSAAFRNDSAAPLSGTERGQISIEWKADDGRELDRTWGPDVGASLASDHWTVLKMDGTAPPDSVDAVFVITFHEGADPKTGAFFVDDAAASERQ